jgi:hypothetical protein
MRLAVETHISLKTVEKWCRGGRVTDANDRALIRAATELGIARANEDHETEKGAP